MSLLNLQTAVYGAPDIEKAKAFYTKVLGIDPYFDESFYVGFQVGGYELGLDPNAELNTASTTAYWGVSDIQATYMMLG